MPTPHPQSVHVHPSRCPECQSTRHTPYHYKPTVHFMGKTCTHGASGLQFNCIITRRTICLDCGTSRLDREFHYFRNAIPCGSATHLRISSLRTEGPKVQ